MTKTIVKSLTSLSQTDREFQILPGSTCSLTLQAFVQTFTQIQIQNQIISYPRVSHTEQRRVQYIYVNPHSLDGNLHVTNHMLAPSRS